MNRNNTINFEVEGKWYHVYQLTFIGIAISPILGINLFGLGWLFTKLALPCFGLARSYAGWTALTSPMKNLATWSALKWRRRIVKLGWAGLTALQINITACKDHNIIFTLYAISESEMLANVPWASYTPFLYYLNSAANTIAYHSVRILRPLRL